MLPQLELEKLDVVKITSDQMRLEQTKNNLEFRDKVQQIIHDVIEPEAPSIIENERYPKKILEELAGEGVAGITISNRYGGMGKGHTELTILSELLATKLMAIPSILSPHWNVSSIVEIFGTERQRTQFLPSMADFSTVAGFALTEKNAGSDTSNIQTEALSDGDNWVINGSKRWVNNLPNADIFLTYARTEKKSKANSGISAFIVPADEFSITHSWNKLGARSVETCEASLENVSIPKHHLVGTLDNALEERSQIYTGINVPGRAIGLSQASIDEAIDYVTSREQYGGRLSEFQGVRWEIAKMAERTVAARAVTMNAARTIDDGDFDPALYHVANVLATEAAVENSNKSMQLHGGIGYTKSRHIERYLREARQMTISGGSIEGHRDSIANLVVG